MSTIKNYLRPANSTSFPDYQPNTWLTSIVHRPSVNGIPVRHRYTHFFKGPCCLCSFENGPSSFTESKIGLVQTVTQPGAAQCVGRYVAMCATQGCSYFGKHAIFRLGLERSAYLYLMEVKLERYFGHPNLMVLEHYRRGKCSDTSGRVTHHSPGN